VRGSRFATAVAAGILLIGVAGSAPASSAPVPAGCCQPASSARPQGAVSNHVIVISIDGLRPDAIEKFDAQVMQRLLREGAYSLSARTIFPSKTLPSHTSMLTGVTPDVHGITWNSDQTDEHGVVQVETVFEVAKRNGFSTAAFFSKAKLRHLQRPNSLDYVQAPRGLEVWMAAQTVEDATRYMRFRRPNLMFVHIAEPDAAGHSIGWMSFAYRWAVRRADSGVGSILAAADQTYGKGNYTVIVTADHGGHGRGHGDHSEEDMQIPWIAYGAGVEPGAVTGQVNTVDTAATVLWLLGIREPTDWSGTAVAQAYTPEARQIAEGALQR
jgi:predicted AlkP superfamily pyrophosphatase or phosphodiesterase